MPNKLQLLAIPLVLALLLFAVSAAHADLAAPSATPIAFEEEAEGEEEDEAEFEEGACEEAEEEFDEGELSAAEVKEICEEEAAERRKKAAGAGSPAPEECILRSAHAQASLISHDEKLKLTIGYTTYEPVAAKLEIGHLATIHRHLGRSGVIREIENLHGDKAPRQLTVKIDLPSLGGAGCPFRRLVLFPR